MNCSNSLYAQRTKSTFNLTKFFTRKPHYGDIFAKCMFTASELLIAATLLQGDGIGYGVFYFSTLLQSQQQVMCCHAQESELKEAIQRIR